jgi:DNA-binding CsgD family transcriptional regulator
VTDAKPPAPAPRPVAPPADPDVALARALGALTAYLARHRDQFPSISPGSEKAWVATLEWGITTVIDTFAPLIPEYRGRSALQLLRREGAVRLIWRIATCQPRLLGRQAVQTILSAQLSLLAMQGGAALQPLPPSTGALDAFFDPSQRRTARRLIERICERSGALRVRIDFAANWRYGSRHLIQALDQEAVAVLGSQGAPGLFALVAWLFLADCWAVRANPVSVAYLTALQLGYERWQRGSDAYRQALTEALVVATRDDLDLAGLEDVGSAAWARVLTGELLDWAGSILVCFREAMEQPGQLAQFGVFDFMHTLERAGKRGRGFELVEEHLRSLTYRVIRLDANEGVVTSPHDPGQRIPELYELRGRIAEAKLTRRQRQVLALRAHDLDFNAIGKELNIDTSTARVLMYRVRRAMGTKQISRRRSA